jgi:hypothetical protein
VRQPQESPGPGAIERLTLVNDDPRYAPQPFQALPTTSYRLLAAIVEGTRGPTPRPRQSGRKRALLRELKGLASEMVAGNAAQRATVYSAASIPPSFGDPKTQNSQGAGYDVAVLVESDVTPGPSSRNGQPEPSQLGEVLAQASGDVLDMPARCIRLIADVDKTRQGLFLFNFFRASDPVVALQLWEHLAAWYRTETGMDSSTLLEPTGECDYVFVNHARWDRSLAGLAAAQFTKRSFRSYVVANMRANHVSANPILYHLA